VYSVGIVFWEIAQRALTGEYAMPYSEYQELVFDFQIIIQVGRLMMTVRLGVVM
jgi:hypothetical protein